MSTQLHALQNKTRELRNEFLKNGPHTAIALLELNETLSKLGVPYYPLKVVASRCVRVLPKSEVYILLAIKKRDYCPEWLKDWNYPSISKSTPEDHLEFLLDNMPCIVNRLDWETIDITTRTNLLKETRACCIRKARNNDRAKIFDSQASLEKMTRREKLKARVKRDASPVRE